MSQYKIIKGKDILEAAIKNGYTHLRGTWIGKDELTGKPIGACFMGQAILNLGADENAFVSKFAGDKVISAITRYNDKNSEGADDDHEHDANGNCIVSPAHTYEEIAEFARKQFIESGYMDADFEVLVSE